MQVLVLNARMQPAPVGVAGELCIAGVGLAHGYLGQPGLTDEKFVAHPFVPGHRIYRTGDLARWLEDGNLEYLGRTDFQLKIRGQRIEPGEIETTLLTHPGVAKAVVVGREDQPGELRLVAYIVAQSGAASDLPDQLLAMAGTRLPLHLVPSAIVLLDALPMTPSRKIDRKALPAPAGASTANAYLAPSGPVEHTLAALVAEVLRLPRVGMNDDFFALGGHSLLATQLISRIRRSLGAELGLKQLFATPVLKTLAGHISSNSTGAGRV